MKAAKRIQYEGKEMKNAIGALLVLMSLQGLSTTAFSLDAVNSPRDEQQWQCDALGRQSFGGPTGDIYISVRGEGPTEFEATDDAISNCMSMGLQMCMVRNCFRLR
jgi:hypothetical protein